MKTNTLYDLVALFGLHLHGEEIGPTFTIDITPFDSVIIKGIGYNPFIKVTITKMMK